MFFHDNIMYKNNNTKLRTLSPLHKLLFHKLRASLSIEAALTLPIFVYACMALVSVITFYQTYVKVENALYNTGLRLAKYEYVYEVIKTGTNVNLEELEEENIVNKLLGQGIEIATIKALVVDELGDDFAKKAHISGGVLGMNFIESDILNEDGIIDIILTYKLDNPFDVFHIGKVSITQRAKVRAYKGDHSIAAKSDKEEEDVYVYITSTGEVYHTNPDCTYIKLNIKKVSKEEIAKLRNESGAKYYSCEKCGKKSMTDGLVYITKFGTRYHNDMNCSELRRGILKVKLESVQDRRLCSKCGEGN